MTVELKPCPFCGSDLIRVKREYEQAGTCQYSIVCDGCFGKFTNLMYYTPLEEVVTMWNRRAKE